MVRSEAARAVTAGLTSVVYLRYDYTTPLLPPNGVVGRQINYPWYTWQLGRAAAAAARRGAFDVVHSQGLCAAGYGFIRSVRARQRNRNAVEQRSQIHSLLRAESDFIIQPRARAQFPRRLKYLGL